MQGSVKKIVSEKGFGFIKPASGPDVFFHCSSLQGKKFEDLAEGDAVDFELDEKADKPRASEVHVQ